MAEYSITWIDATAEAYIVLPPPRRHLIDERLERLAADPELDSSYDPATAWWTTTYANGSGLIMFSISARHRRLVMLRILDLG